MHILMTGGTGLIGRRLCAELTARGDQVTVLTRRPHLLANLCGSAVRPMRSLDEWKTDQHFDAIINLAGEPIIDKAWSAQRKQVLLDSRVGLTQTLIQKIRQASSKPTVLLSGSAIGYYGMHAEEIFYEDAQAGHDFSATLCAQWEQAAAPVKECGVRLVYLRTGLVLDEAGGVLKKILLPFELGMGSRLGNGKQWMSWIHRQDYLRAVLHLLDDAQAEGPFNLTSPMVVNNAELTHDLAHALHRPAWFVTPAFVLKLVLGERSDLLLGGQKVLPKALLAKGFQFEFPNLPAAFAHLLQK